MKYFSTFSGIGGFEIGIEQAHRAIQARLEATQLDGRTQRQRDNDDTGQYDVQTSQVCVGFSEIDKYAASVYQYHFKGVPAYGDITKINAKELPDFDCLVGGFPCQAFSIAGKRKGFADTRGTLFFDLARILAAKKPRLFVFENVKGLLSHDHGNTFKTIIATIDELGYDCQWQVLNSKNFGVPQNRERIYIVGHLRGTPRPEVFPITGTYGEATESQRGNKIAIPVLTPDRIVKRQNGRRFKTDGEPAFTVNTQDRHGVVVQVPEATKKGYAEATTGQAINLSVPNSKTRRGRVSDIAPTLDTGMQLHTLTEDVRIRRLTPKECERLQGFPDDWTKQGIEKAPSKKELDLANGSSLGSAPVSIIPISDTQRYKMCGNAVTTNVVQAVFERLLA